MNISRRTLGVLLIAFFAFSALAVADTTRDIPLRGAPAPSMAEAARVINAARVTPFGTATPQTHIVNPGAFVFQTITPCRLVDTRNSLNFYGGPIFGNAETRTYDPAQGITCGGSSLPDALAWYANITVTGTTGGPSFLTAYATGTPRPGVATVNWPAAGSQVNNSVIVAAGTSSAFDVYASQGTHVIIDLVGFFISNLTGSQDQLAIVTNIGGAAAILGQNDSITNGSHGVGGFASGTGTVHGVQGQISNAAGPASSGVHGIAGNTGDVKGVLGEVSSTAGGANGVEGRGGALPGGQDPNIWFNAGVAGFSLGGYGVHGVSEFNGVHGVLMDSAGFTLARGRLGFASGGTNYGVFSSSNYGGTGAKFFVEPHPEKAGMVIRYVALEGPESGTYFRGRGRFEGGYATIDLPEDFRMVTDAEGLSIQVTPIGQMASVAVLQIDLNGIVVRGSRDVEFFYLVNGVRKTHKHLTPIGFGNEYMPEDGNQRMPAFLTEGQKQMLISNGTYNADGTVNMQTARRLGWDKIWEQRQKSNGSGR